jgi:predicted TIM-barrel fold metal-dependent hydrolase
MTETSALNETILEPDLPIIDPHHHLWDRMIGANPADLPPPRHGFENVLRLAPRYLFHDLLADMQRGHNVKATVFLQCGAMYNVDAPPHLRPVGETEFVNGVAAMSASGIYGDVRACAGIVGHVDLTQDPKLVTEALEAHVRAGGGRFRGIRHSCSYDADAGVLGPLAGGSPGLYMSDAFRAGFARLAPLGMSFDAWLLEPQIPELIDLARAFPETPIVMDHVGTPLGIASYSGKREERFGTWRDNVRTLASCPNVFVKLGGLAMVFPGFPSFMSNPPAPSTQLAAEWKPYIETCIEAFGPKRCMFESNFPVDLGSCTYDVLWNAFKVLAKGCSADEKTALFSGSAAAFYKLKL